MPTRIPLVKGILSSPAASIVARRFAGCLVGEPAWTVSISRSEVDSSIRPCEAVTSRRRARSSELEHADVGVRQDAALQGSLAGPDDVGGEVVVAPLGQLGGHLGVDLGPLAGEDQELLGVASLGLVQLAFNRLGRVDMRLPGREGAVLAVALAGAGQREGVVPREGDPAHGAQATTAGRPPPGHAGPAARESEDGGAQAAEPGFGAAGALTRSGGSVGDLPPGSRMNWKTPAASSEPTSGPTM